MTLINLRKKLENFCSYLVFILKKILIFFESVLQSIKVLEKLVEILFVHVIQFSKQISRFSIKTITKNEIQSEKVGINKKHLRKTVISNVKVLLSVNNSISIVSFYMFY